MPDRPAMPEAALRPPPSPDDDYAPGASPWRRAVRRLLHRRGAVAGALVLALLAAACAVGPALLADGAAGPAAFARKLQAPGAAHWFGTDALGRDVFARVLSGGRVSLAVGLCGTLVSLAIGVAWGAVAGFAGGKADAAMMRIADILFALPFTVFVVLVMVFCDALARRHGLGAGWNVFVLFAAIGAVEWPAMARIVRGQVRALRRQEFVEAAVTLGLPTHRIVTRHMIPNVLGPVVVYAALTVPAVILREAFLSFLGLGVQPPMSSWGTLIKDGADAMVDFPWLLVGPGAVFASALFSLALLGDGLRDAFDVRVSED
jgi:oligopeptide transport system permease protein